MFKKISFTCLLFTLVGQLKAQDLRIVNTINNMDVTDSSIEIRYSDNSGFQGYESLDLGIKITNVSNDLMEIGAKKIEEDALQPDVQHTICFAGNCYPTSVFVAPNNIQLGPGESDSGFIAHFLFDNRVHVSGVNHVSYMFYNVNPPSDSVVVHVTYNTNVVTAIGNVHTDAFIQVYPNPADNNINFRSLNSSNSLNKSELFMTDMRGKTQKIPSVNNTSFDVSALPEGVYQYRLILRESDISYGTISIIR